MQRRRKKLTFIRNFAQINGVLEGDLKINIMSDLNAEADSENAGLVSEMGRHRLNYKNNNGDQRGKGMVGLSPVGVGFFTP